MNAITDEGERANREESFSCSGPIELDVRLESGSLEVKALETPRVVVALSESSPPPRWQRSALVSRLGGERWPELARRALNETQVEWSEAGRLRIRTPRARLLRAVPVAIVVEVPTGSRLVSRSGAGSVHASGVLGQLEAAIGSGDITAERVDGNVDVKAGAGDVRLGHVGGGFRVRSGSGDIEAASVEGTVEAVCGRGGLRLGVVRADARARTGSGEIAVAEARSGRLDLVTGSGDVRVGIPAGVAAELDVVSGSGQARSELPIGDIAPEGDPPVQVHARTGRGEAVVTTAA
jgi:Putative adhesin